MKIEIPRIEKEIPLREYAPEFEQACFRVWVNPPRALLDQMESLGRAFLDPQAGPEARLTALEESAGVIGQLWNETAEQVVRFMTETHDTDPMLFQWVLLRTFQLIRDHRRDVKKN